MLKIIIIYSTSYYIVISRYSLTFTTIVTTINCSIDIWQYWIGLALNVNFPLCLSLRHSWSITVLPWGCQEHTLNHYFELHGCVWPRCTFAIAFSLSPTQRSPWTVNAWCVSGLSMDVCGVPLPRVKVTAFNTSYYYHNMLHVIR